MEGENKSNFKLFKISKKTYIVDISVALAFWVISLIFFLLPNVEHDILIAFNDLRVEGSLFQEFWYFYTKWFIYIFGFLLLGLYLLSFKAESLKKYRQTMLISVILYGLGSPLLDYGIKNIVNRTRPYEIWGDLINVYDVESASFPSGHTYIGIIMILPLVMALLSNDEYFKSNMKKIALSLLLITYATMMTLSRIFVGVHFPSDVAWSIGLAILLSLLVHFILKKLIESGKLNENNEKWYATIFLVIILIVVALSLIL